MKSLIPIVTVSILSATLVGTSYAGSVKEKREDVREEQRDVKEKQKELREEVNEQMQDVSRATKIIGTGVKNTKGEDLGNIKDLVLNPMRGNVVYAVVSYGGILGMGDKLFAVPWSALRWTADKDYYVLNMDKDALKNAPGFDEDHWPDSTNKWEQQREQLNQFYRVKP
ncbi:MAG: PRC-barrel domain-containing protein [Methylosarcina sp.]